MVFYLSRETVWLTLLHFSNMKSRLLDSTQPFSRQKRFFFFKGGMIWRQSSFIHIQAKILPWILWIKADSKRISYFKSSGPRMQPPRQQCWPFHVWRPSFHCLYCLAQTAEERNGVARPWLLWLRDRSHVNLLPARIGRVCKSLRAF